MPKKKYYAVRKGTKTGIFRTWPECEAVIKGYPGAEFKGFAELEEAQAYLEIGRQGDSGGWGDSDVIAFVDGSFDLSLGRYSYACIFLTPEGEEQICGYGEDEEKLKIRNVAGEMLGAEKAVLWAIDHGFTSIQLRYDYQGIENWVTGTWQARNALTQAYARTMHEYAQKIQISFKKVAAHCGDEFNEKADLLAKAALRG